MQQGRTECSREVDAHLLDSSGQQPSQGRQGQESQQEYAASGAARGAAEGSGVQKLKKLGSTKEKNRKSGSGEMDPG